MFGIPRLQIVNMLQNILMFFGASLTANGVISGDDLAAIVSGLVTLVVVVLNVYTQDDALHTPVPTEPKDGKPGA